MIYHETRTAFCAVLARNDWPEQGGKVVEEKTTAVREGQPPLRMTLCHVTARHRAVQGEAAERSGELWQWTITRSGILTMRNAVILLEGRQKGREEVRECERKQGAAQRAEAHPRLGRYIHLGSSEKEGV